MSHALKEAGSSLALSTRRAPQAANSFNSETRTFTVVAATGGARVTRRDWDTGELVDEVIDLAASDYHRLQGGPLLQDHNATSNGQVGVVLRAWVDGDRLLAECRLSPGAYVDQLAADIQHGIRQGISVGYRVKAANKVAPGKGNTLPTLKVAVEFLEISIVPIPADPSSGPQP